MSAIVRRTTGGFDILYNPSTESHEDLVVLHKLKDNREGNFARVEFTPEDGKSYDNPKAYELKVDESVCPEWFTESMKEKVSERMRRWVKEMIVHGDVDLICGGIYILASDAKVGCVKGSVLKVMWESSKVGEMRESSKVGEMWGSSNVGVMWESSNVGVMWGSSKVGVMWGSSKVGVMWGSSKVGVMCGSSKVEKDQREKKE